MSMVIHKKILFCNSCPFLMLLAQSEVSTTREQLLSEFLPDDLCSIKGPLFAGTPKEMHKSESFNSKSLEKVNYFCTNLHY